MPKGIQMQHMPKGIQMQHMPRGMPKGIRPWDSNATHAQGDSTLGLKCNTCPRGFDLGTQMQHIPRGCPREFDLGTSNK
ncbi:hypothetical protein AMTR_s00071p00164360 [Amborella trichopoda]|uniref:Uncharacterized protein n=1 Tax=Amborella trichopoda TaxID=13333 RepID=U5DCU3_AMBTC|nr:hypothetical protein AMTR_s00071p00164360 [Amborella trichopoda]